MAAQLLNIEIGDRLSKVCLSKAKGKNFEIKESFMFQTPEGMVSDGQILQPDELAEVLKEQIAGHRLSKVKKVIFSLASSKVATREVTIPPVSENRIPGIIQSNASEYFPVDISKYHVTQTLLDRSDKGDNPGCRVLVYAVLLELLEGYFKVADRAGLSVSAIDYAGNSQYQALRSLAGEEVTMYVNVDCKSSLVTFMHKDELLMQRSLVSGGDDLLLSYGSAAGVSDYVKALHDCSSETPAYLSDGSMTAADAEDALSRLVSGIARSNDYYNTNHWSNPVTKVVLMGPCCHLAGLREQVAAATELPTTYLDDSLGNIQLASPADKPSFYITCIGSGAAPVDFMPPQFAAAKKKQKQTSDDTKQGSILGGLLICILCIGLISALSYMAISNYNDAVEEKEKVERQIAELSYTRDVYNSYQVHKAGADTLLGLDAMIDSPNDNLNAFLTELEEKMPTEIIFLSAVCERDAVMMNVTVTSFEAAAKTISQLRSFESLADVQTSDLNQTENEIGETTVSFSLVCTYGENPYLNNVYPYGIAN